MTGVILVLAWTLFNIGISESRLTQSRLQNSHLQRVLNHKRVSVILEGVRNRALTTIQNDPILQISFPQIAHTFEVRKKVIFFSFLVPTFLLFSDSLIRRYIHFKIHSQTSRWYLVWKYHSSWIEVTWQYNYQWPFSDQFWTRQKIWRPPFGLFQLYSKGKITSSIQSQRNEPSSQTF